MPLLPQPANSADNNETQTDNTPVPAGEYLSHIIKTEIKETKAGTGHRLNLTFKILDGDHEGRVFWQGLNISNPSAVAQEISRKELNSICKACGLEDVEDSDELLQIPLIVRLKVVPGTDQWPAKNEPTGYAMETSSDDFDSTKAETKGSETQAKPWEEAAA